MSSLAPDTPGAGCEAVTFRAATAEDRDWLVALRIEAMGPHLRAAGEEVTPQGHVARVMADFDCIRIVLQGAQPIGMVKVARTPVLWKLVQIQIGAAQRGRGIGGWIVGGLLAEARRHGVPLSLSVLKVNPARRLYERLGFRIVAQNAHSFEMRADPGPEGEAG
jgi:GNAT superfamily N-acetyltransferase